MARGLRREVAVWTFLAVSFAQPKHRVSSGFGARCEPRGSVAELSYLSIRPLCHVGTAAFQLRLRGGVDDLESESEDKDTSEDEKEYRKRPVMIGRSGGGNSIRIIPAAPGQLLGDARWFPDDGIAEWVLADPQRKTAMVAPTDARSILVPEDESKVHKAIAASVEGDRILVRTGLHRWEGAIKVRKGYWRGIHIEGEEGTVLWGQWLLGRHSAGSMKRVGGACNASTPQEALLDVHAGPWSLEGCELRCLGGLVVSVVEFAELNASRCTLGGMAADPDLRAACGVFLADHANLALHGCSVVHSGGLEGAGPDATGVALMCGGNAHVHVVNTSIADHGIALALQANASAVVARCLLQSISHGCFFVTDCIDTALCLVNTRCEGSLTWFDFERPKHLNDYLFQGYSLTVPERPPRQDASPEDAEGGARGRGEAEEENEEEVRAWRKKMMIDLDPSLFPDPWSHLYVYHPDEAPAEPLDPDSDERPRDEYTYRPAPPHTLCYNCGERGHWGPLCPEGQRAVEDRAVMMITPRWAEWTGINEELEDRKRARADRKREALGLDDHGDPNLDADARLMMEVATRGLRKMGLDPKDAPQVRWNKLDLVNEWYNELKGKWEVLPDPFFGPMEGKIPRGVMEGTWGMPEGPERAEEDGDGDGDDDDDEEGPGERLTAGQVERLNAIRKDDGLPALSLQEWKEERARLRKVYAEEESEDNMWEI